MNRSDLLNLGDINGFKNPIEFFDLGEVEMKITSKDNKRFCMIKSIPNLGTQILKNIRKRSKMDWKCKYGNDLRAIVTTIGDGKKGSVYLADNWVKIGETAGLPAGRKSVSMKWDNNEGIKEKYTKPTGENRKIILITDRL